MVVLDKSLTAADGREISDRGRERCREEVHGRVRRCTAERGGARQGEEVHGRVRRVHGRVRRVHGRVRRCTAG